MESRIPCRICSASILVATAERTGGICMTCVKNPDWFERKQAKSRKPGKKRRLDRKLSVEREPNAHDTISQFEFLCSCDGLGQAHVEELVVVSHCLKRCKATKCRKVIERLLDFIEEGCSPEGYFDPELEEEFLMSHSEQLDEFEREYLEASRAERPTERAKNLG